MAFWELNVNYVCKIFFPCKTGSFSEPITGLSENNRSDCHPWRMSCGGWKIFSRVARKIQSSTRVHRIGSENVPAAVLQQQIHQFPQESHQVVCRLHENGEFDAKFERAKAFAVSAAASAVASPSPMQKRRKINKKLIPGCVC